MKYGIFIQADEKQSIGAKVAKYALETRGKAKGHGIPVTIMQVEDNPTFTKYAGMQYKRGNELRTHDANDLQFFTLSRFMPPELMAYEGRALVIDPDIFALDDIQPLIEWQLGDASVAACKVVGAKGDTWWDSSVMVLDNTRLRHWNIEKLLEGLKNGTEDYRNWSHLSNERVTEIPRVWNSLDLLTPETKMLHTTKRLTQPWKTGLPVDFIPGVVPKLFGFIPRFWVTHPTHYQTHPDKQIEKFFFILTQEALTAGAITNTEIDSAITAGDIRPDIRKLLTHASAN